MMQRDCLLVVLSLLTASWQTLEAFEGASPCPAPDWLYHQESNRCFFMKEKISGLSFFEAQQYCDKIGFKMAAPKTQDVVEFMIQRYQRNGDFWLGLTDVTSKGRLKWEDETTLTNIALWDRGYPKRQDTGDQCVYVNIASKKLRDRSCFDRQHKVVCQMEDVSFCEKSPNHCEYKCLDLGNKAWECQCEAGYDIYQTTKCKDVDECQYNNGGCEQHCNNTIGSYECICETGKALLGGRVCKNIEEQQGLMATELISLVITIAFPVFSIMGCIFMALWRKKRVDEANKMNIEDEGEGGKHEEEGVAGEEMEGYEEQEHYEENYDEEYYDDAEQYEGQY